MTTNLTEFLAEQKRLTEAATKGPWEYSPTILGLPNTTILAPASGEHVSYVALAHAAEQTAAFIAAARSSAPRMIAALEAVLEVADAYDQQPDVMEPCGAAAQSIRFAIEDALKGESDDPML